MKSSMPRLIDDKRRNACCLVLSGTIAVSILAVCAYNAYMKPYRARRAEILGKMNEGATFHEDFQKELEGRGESGRGPSLSKLCDTEFLCYDGEGMPESFDIDPRLYVEEDREKAAKLAREYLSAVDAWNHALSDYSKATNDAAATVASYKKLQGAKEHETAVNALCDLKTCLDELEALWRLARPSADATAVAFDRFDQSLSVAYGSRSALDQWRGAMASVANDADRLTESMETAIANMGNAAGRAEAIQKEVARLRVDRDGEQLRSFRESITEGIAALEDVECASLEAVNSARNGRSELITAARKTCSDATANVEALFAAHGAMLPEDAVSAVSDAPESLESIIHEEDEEWKKRVDAIISLHDNAKMLVEDARVAIRQLDDFEMSGRGLPNSASIAVLPNKLKDMQQRIADATEDIHSKELEERIGVIKAKIRQNLETIEMAKPDVAKCVEAVHNEAGVVKAELGATRTVLDKLRRSIENGIGPAKDALTTALDKCSTSVSGCSEELQALEVASAKNGKDVLKLRDRMASARGTVQADSERAESIGEDIRKAMENGSLSFIVWENGFLGWNPNGIPIQKTVFSGDVLVAPQGTSSSSYEWEFALDFDEPGNHKITVLGAPTAKSGRYNLNNAIPSKAFKGGDQGKSRKGGWINVDCMLSCGVTKWRMPEMYTVPNFDRVANVDGESILEAEGRFEEGRHTFQLRLNLSFDARHLANDKIPDTSKGWCPEGIGLSIHVDGIPVTQFVHKRQ